MAIGLEAILLYGHLQDRQADEACRERGGISVSTFGGSGWTCAWLERR
jgi:hypothetical protein